MIICHDNPVIPDNHTRAERSLLALLLASKQAIKHRIIRKGRLLNLLTRIDIHHSRRCLFHERGKAQIHLRARLRHAGPIIALCVGGWGCNRHAQNNEQQDNRHHSGGEEFRSMFSHADINKHNKWLYCGTNKSTSAQSMKNQSDLSETREKTPITTVTGVNPNNFTKKPSFQRLLQLPGVPGRQRLWRPHRDQPAQSQPSAHCRHDGSQLSEHGNSRHYDQHSARP